MVYCPKCGTKNTDDAKTCSECGGPLHSVGEREPYRRVEEECFGIPRGGTIVSLAVGIIILLVGGIWLLQQTDIIPENVEIWPFIVMIFGILIIIGAFYKLRRRY